MVNQIEPGRSNTSSTLPSTGMKCLRREVAIANGSHRRYTNVEGVNPVSALELVEEHRARPQGDRDQREEAANVRIRPSARMPRKKRRNVRVREDIRIAGQLVHM